MTVRIVMDGYVGFGQTFISSSV